MIALHNEEIEYYIVSKPAPQLEKFYEEIKEKSKDGYKLHGYLQVIPCGSGEYYHIQAMYKIIVKPVELKKYTIGIELL